LKNNKTHKMNDENIIRDEAHSFATIFMRIGAKDSPIEIFEKVKLRLLDFYPNESKAIFLDEIKKYIESELEKHRDQKHGGKPDPACDWESTVDKLQFYIRQELGTLPAVAYQKTTTATLGNRNKVFISYCHRDIENLKDIRRHFKPFLKYIDFWDDSRIKPGQKWKEEIKKAINEVKVAILLVSTDFLGSEFIATDELPPLLRAAEEEGAVILVVIIKPCLFEDFPELNQFQSMNPPNKPVSKMEINEREELYVNIVRQTKKILNSI
jgi:hypothetical protein